MCNVYWWDGFTPFDQFCWKIPFLLLPGSLLWRHNGRDGVSNHQPHDCLLNRLFRRRSKKTSKLHVTGLCAGNPLGPVNSLHKRPVTRKMFPFDDAIIFTVSRYSKPRHHLQQLHYHASCCSRMTNYQHIDNHTDTPAQVQQIRNKKSFFSENRTYVKLFD